MAFTVTRFKWSDVTNSASAVNHLRLAISWEHTTFSGNRETEMWVANSDCQHDRFPRAVTGGALALLRRPGPCRKDPFGQSISILPELTRPLPFESGRGQGRR
ncbi:MAG: hypothetical protein CMJ75_03880 [Planctomycetaceae bacterium]|nr:hypothetical protein [Planctomycetaceae bacterium]